MSNRFKILNEEGESVQENISSYEEAWEFVQQVYPNFAIEEYDIPVVGLGRDPDLHKIVKK